MTTLVLMAKCQVNTITTQTVLLVSIFESWNSKEASHDSRPL